MRVKTIAIIALMLVLLGVVGIYSTVSADDSGAFLERRAFISSSDPVQPIHPTVSLNARNSAAGPYTVYLPLVSSAQAPSRALWRFGIGAGLRPVPDYSPWLSDMRFGWYINWAASSTAPEPNGMEFVQVVRVKQWKLRADGSWTNYCAGCPYVTPYTYTVSPSPSLIRSIAYNRPGKLWLVGNEIESQDTSGGSQDEILPELYAQAYHDIYAAIKQGDPTALVSNGSLVEPTPLRLAYLDRVWNAYQSAYGTTMPVDVWNMHLYVLPEASCSTCWGAGIPAGLADTSGMNYALLDNKNFSIAAGLVNNLRVWMKQHGQQDKPLILSEYGVNMPDWVAPGQFTPEQIRDSFMNPSFDYFLNHTDANLGNPADGYRLVQRWNFWSLDYDVGTFSNGTFYQEFNGNLFNSGLYASPQGITSLGRYYQQYVQSLPLDSTKPAALFSPRVTTPSKTSLASNNLGPSATSCSSTQPVQQFYYESSQTRLPIFKEAPSVKLLSSTTVNICRP